MRLINDENRRRMNDANGGAEENCRDLYARVCLWLVQAWDRISSTAIFC